jgi:hypothetical protein
VSATTTQLLSSGEIFKLLYDTIPVESVSANVSFYTNNSKRTNFEFVTFLSQMSDIYIYMSMYIYIYINLYYIAVLLIFTDSQTSNLLYPLYNIMHCRRLMFAMYTKASSIFRIKINPYPANVEKRVSS